MNREAIHQYIDTHIEQHTEHVQAWVRQPSVSWDNMGVGECAGLVADSYRQLGCQHVELIDGHYHPGVWAQYDCGAPRTIHNYCMFDTRTVNPRDWSYDPWGAELTAIGPYPKVLVGRGALGAKGPYVAWLNALASIIAIEGALPINIRFLAEGEEILGSPTYREFVERHAEQLADVDVSFCPASTQNASGAVSMGLGLKGMVVIELTASGAAWGYGPQQTVHSSTAGLVDCPPFRLAAALATLVDTDGRGCRVRGLQDAWHYRKPLSAEEQSLLEALQERFAGRDWRDILPLGGAENVQTVNGGLNGMAPLLNFLYGPTFNIAGLRSGFLGPNTSTGPFIVPAQATATLDMRMVVEIPPEEIIEAIRVHLDAHGFSDIDIQVYSAFGHAQTSIHEPVVQSVLQTARRWGVESIVWPMEAGGGPWTVVPNRFNVPCVRGGVIGGGRRSDADEFMVIEGDGTVAGLADVEKYYVDLVHAYAQSAEATA